MRDKYVRLKLTQVREEEAYAWAERPYSWIGPGYDELKKVIARKVGVPEVGRVTPSRVEIEFESGYRQRVMPSSLICTWEQHVQAQAAKRRQDDEEVAQRMEQIARRERRLAGYRRQLAEVLGVPDLPEESLLISYRLERPEDPVRISLTPEIMARLVETAGGEWRDVTAAPDALAALLARASE